MCTHAVTRLPGDVLLQPTNAVTKACCVLQIDALRQQQPHLLVATPGRLLDLVDDEDCPLSLGRLFLTPYP